MTDAPTLLDAALGYAARGWPVFPCSDRNKRPLLARDKDAAGKGIRGTGGFTKATTDADTIRAWWRKWPKAMIGLAMGRNGLFAVDFDPRTDPDTGEEWTLDRLRDELEAEIGTAFPASLSVRTPSGGVHVYFKMPDGPPITNRGNLPLHVDVRGEGGYVIAPPSYCQGDGKNATGGYRWLRGNEAAEIIAPPAELVAILRASKGASVPGGLPSNRGAGEADERVRKYALSALDAECEKIRRAPSGKRQDTLNTGAYCIAQLVAANAIGEPAARGSIRAAAMLNPGKDSEAQIEATIDSGWAAGIVKPRDLATIVAGNRSAGGARLREANDNPPLRESEDAGVLNRRLCQWAQTDLGNAERFAARYGERVRYVDKMGWVAYDGRRFILDGAEALIGGWVQRTVRAIRDEARIMRDSGRRDRGDDGALDDLIETKRDGTEVLLSDKLASWAKASESAAKLACIAGIARHLTNYGITVQPEQLDRDPFLINVQNGTLELIYEPGTPDSFAELRLRPHDPQDLITRLAPFDYAPGAECPVYDRFLDRVQPDALMRAFLHRWGGLSLTGDVTDQKLAFFHGKGANGKSTLVDTWATVAGDYAATVPIETFLDQGRKRKGSEASPDLAALVGARLLRTSEPEKGSKLAEALIKLATGGEPMSVRRLNRDPFDLLPAFKMTVSGNHKPSISGTDDGIWRRVMMVPWDVQIPDSEKDRQLVAKMKREGSGILNRLLAGLIDWRLGGLREPESVRVATADYRDQSDPMGRFLTLCTRPDPGKRSQSSKLYALFLAWAKASGEREWTQTGFSKAMLDRGYRKIESHGMHWLDVEMVKQPFDFDEPDAMDAGRSPHPWQGDDDDMPC